jgi:pilus assembly protein Flp/PilA
MAVPSFMTVSPLEPADVERGLGVSWNRNPPIGKARAPRRPGSSDMHPGRDIRRSRTIRARSDRAGGQGETAIYPAIRRKVASGFNRIFSVFVDAPATKFNLDCAYSIGAEESVEGVDRSFRMRRLLVKFLADQSGATAIEYCLIAAGISIVIVVAVNGIGTTLNTKFTSVNSSLK